MIDCKNYAETVLLNNDILVSSCIFIWMYSYKKKMEKLVGSEC